MAFNLKRRVFVVVAVAALVVFSLTKCAASEDGAGEQRAETSGSQKYNGLVPVIVVRQSQGGSSPDFFLGWMDWESFAPFTSFFKPFTQGLSPMTQQMSGMMNQIPGLSQGYQTVSSLANQMNPLSFLGGLGGGQGGQGGQNPLSSLFGR